MTTALILVDVQRDMLDPPNPVPSHELFRETIASLLERARAQGVMVVHIQNDGPRGEPDEPGTPGWPLVFPVSNGETVVRKTSADAFEVRSLGALLDAKGVDRVVVAGFQSNYCIASTCRGGIRRKLEVILVSGAHATYDEHEEAAQSISTRVEKELQAEGVILETWENAFGAP